NAGEYGIRVGTDLDAADNCLLVDNEIVGAANDGILVNAGSNGATLIGNRIRNVLDDGIQLMQNSEGHVLDQNDVRQCASSGVVVYADFATVSRSRVKKAGFDGLIVQSLADECLFLDNRVRASGDDGFRVASGGHSFVGNKASKNVGFDL